MMPINESVAHLQLIVGSGIVLTEPGQEQPIPMPPEAAEEMCADLDARGEHHQAERHRRELKILLAVEQGIEDPRSGHGGMDEW